MKKFIFLCATLFCLNFADAKITMPQLFQSGMVMQRGKIIPVWGKAYAGETITISFNKKQYTTTADAEGRWRVDMPKMKAGGPYTLEVKSGEVKGEKWFTLQGQRVLNPGKGIYIKNGKKIMIK